MVNALISRGGGLELVGVQAIIKDLGPYLRGAKQVEDANKRMGDSSEQTAKRTGSLISAAAKLTGALALAGGVLAGAAVRGAAQYQTTLAKIDALTNTTAEDTERLGKGILELSKRVPKSADELGAAAYFALSSGIKDVDEALELVEVSAKAASAGLGETQDIVNLVTSIMNAYGHENISAAQATDVLVATVREGKGEANQFANEIGRIIPIAATLGISFDELGAVLAVLTNAGLNASEATTALLGIMNQLLSPSAQAREALEGVGLSVEDLRRSLDEKGLVETMFTLIKAFDGNVDSLVALLPEVRGLNGALSAFVSQGNATRTVLENIRKAGGITEEAFKRMSETFNFQKDLLKNQLNVLLIQLGSQILPTLTSGLQSASRWLNENEAAIRRFVTGAGKNGAEIFKTMALGVKTLTGALDWIPSNEGRIIGAIAAIGVAMVIAFGPASAAFLAVSALVYLVGKLAGASGPTAQQSQFRTQTIQDQAIADQRTGMPLPSTKALSETNLSTEEMEIYREAFQRAAGTYVEVTKESSEAAADASINLDAQSKATGGAADSSKELAAAEEYQKKVTDALKDGIITFAEAAELSITAAQAGILEGNAAIEAEGARMMEQSFNISKAFAAVTTALGESTRAAEQYVLSLVREALTKAQAAAGALFGAPTQEQAQLGLQAAQQELQLARTSAATDAQIRALEAQKAALERVVAGNDMAAASVKRQIAAIDAQIAQVKRQTETGEASLKQTRLQIELLDKQAKVQQAQLEAANKSLLTEAERRVKTQELIVLIGQESQAVRALSRSLNVDLIPEMDAARQSAAVFRVGLDALGGPGGSLDQTTAAAGLASSHLSLAANAALSFADAANSAAGRLNSIVIAPPPPPGGTGGTGGHSTFGGGGSITLAAGDIVTSPTRALIAEAGPEAVIPLTNPARAREIMANLPPGFLNSLLGTGAASGAAPVTFTVQGATLDEQRAMVHREIDYYFNQKRSQALRSGALTSTGIY